MQLLLLLLPDLCMFQEQQHKTDEACAVLWLFLMIKLSNDAYGRLQIAMIQEYFGVNAPKDPHHSIQLFTSAIRKIQHSSFFFSFS